MAFRITYKLRRRLEGFRQKYNPPKVSTYALGESIYQFLRCHSSVEKRLYTLSAEIEAADNFERMGIERKESRQLTFLTWIATLSVPLATIASIYAVPDKYLFHLPFWLSSIGVTALFIVVIFIFRRFSSKQAKSPLQAANEQMGGEYDLKASGIGSLR